MYSPDNALCTRADGFEVLISLEDCEPCVPHLHCVEVRGSGVARRHFVVGLWTGRQKGHGPDSLSTRPLLLIRDPGYAH